MLVWRIATDTPIYAADDITGEGAKRTGGRWNRKSAPLLYASTSRALACLETIVHLGGAASLPLNRYLVEVMVPDAAWSARTVFDPVANVGWDAEPPGKVSLDWGTSWTMGLTTLVAEVPSVVVPEELNILINPRHADGVSVRAHKVRKWTYDARLRPFSA
jgi:RES domain-containing protein